MKQFFLDKRNKVPLYLQLKDQVRYYISTGVLKSQDRLPPIKALADELQINFLTVRKAYKELEDEGLVSIKHGGGCFISLYKSQIAALDSGKKTGDAVKNKVGDNFLWDVRGLIELYRARGLSFSSARQTIETVIDELELSEKPMVVFAECNEFQIREISALLEQNLGLDVKPLLVSDLANKLESLASKDREVHVVTTGFHVNEVRQIVGNLPTVSIEVLITNLNPETRRKLESFGEKGEYGFICRDQESALLYKELLKAELGFEQFSLTSCTFLEKDKVQKILKTVDVVLTSPPVYEDVKKLASPDTPVFNLFERVDPMSLKVLKDRIHRVCKETSKPG